MSQYPKHFIEPIFQKTKQQELTQSGEIENVYHMPVRAAKNDQNDSVFQDTTVA